MIEQNIILSLYELYRKIVDVEADKEVYKNIDPKSSELYRLANQFRKDNADVVGDKPVKNDAGEMSMSDDSKQKAC